MNAYLNKYTSPIFTAYASCGLCHGKMSDPSVCHTPVLCQTLIHTLKIFLPPF